jgi:hypothetical protein
MRRRVGLSGCPDTPSLPPPPLLLLVVESRVFGLAAAG